MATKTKQDYFVPENAGTPTTHESPSGKYRLAVTPFATGKGSWSYTQGCVYAGTSAEPIATIQRNYSAFPYLFIDGHPNGHDYLVAGEDYQGQTVVELDTGRRLDFLPEQAALGAGFCWGSCEWVPSMQALLVDGCYWAAPYEYRFYDFADPMSGWPQIGEDAEMLSDVRKPVIQPDGRIQVFQTEYTEDDDEEEGEPKAPPPIAAFTVYRRDGLQLVQVDSWVSEKEQSRRQKSKEARERYEQWLADFKANDPLYRAMLVEVAAPVFLPEAHMGVGRTYKGWCEGFDEDESRITRRIHRRENDSGTGYTIDLEWAAKTGPIKLVIFKDGKTYGERIFQHSAEGMQEAFSHASGLVQAGVTTAPPAAD